MTKCMSWLAAGALCLTTLMASANAAVATFDGASTDGTAGEIEIETLDPVTAGFFVTETSYPLVIEVAHGGQVYTLEHTQSEFFLFGIPIGGAENPYIVDRAVGNTVTFTAADPGLLAAGSLETLTLQFASAFTGTGAAAFAEYLTSAALISFEARPLGEAAFTVVIGASGVPVPGAALLFVTGAALIARRKG